MTGNNRVFLIGLMVVIAFGAGCLLGFFAGVGSTKAGSRFMREVLSSESPAETEKPQLITRKAFQLKYPRNWKVDTADEDYEPDHLFSINSSGQSTVTFVILEKSVDQKEHVRIHENAFVPKLIADPTRTEFRRWGRFEGNGVELKGHMLHIVRGSVRIFCHSGKNSSFTVIEQTNDEDAPSVKPGFALVENSFTLTDKP